MLRYPADGKSRRSRFKSRPKTVRRDLLIVIKLYSQNISVRASDGTPGPLDGSASNENGLDPAPDRGHFDTRLRALFVLPVGLALLSEGAGALDQVLRLEEFLGRGEVDLVGFLERHVQAGVRGFLARLNREGRTFHDFGGPLLGGGDQFLEGDHFVRESPAMGLGGGYMPSGHHH